MTVPYSLEVSSARFLAFTRLIFRWRGSIYKLMTVELVVFVAMYYVIFFVNKYALNEPQKETFTNLCLYFRNYLDLVPITFVLGFYVSLVATRWWSMYMTLPWPDRSCVLVATYVHGNDTRGRMIRRTLARYLNISSILSLRCISSQVKRRFPTLDHLVDSNVITEAERKSIESRNRNYGEYFQPILWFGSLISEARREGRITDDIYVRHIMAEVGDLRSSLGTLMNYDWVTVPLVYTQVVSIAVYMFFFGCLFGRQYLDQQDASYWLTQYFPLFTFVQFFFYMGWLKVAEVLINPLGEDDEDFELNYIIDRNLAIGFQMVDDLYGSHPPMERDAYWDDTDPFIPYTTAAANTYIEPFLGSAVDIDVPESRQEWAPVEAEGDIHSSSATVDTTSSLVGAMRKFTRTISQMTGGSGPGRNQSITRQGSKGRKVISIRRRSVARNRKSSRLTSVGEDSTASSITSQSHTNPAFDDDGAITDAIVDELIESEDGAAFSDENEPATDKPMRKKVSWSTPDDQPKADAATKKPRKLSGRNEELKPENVKPAVFDTLTVLAEEEEEGEEEKDFEMKPVRKSSTREAPQLNGLIPQIREPEPEDQEPERRDTRENSDEQLIPDEKNVENPSDPDSEPPTA